MFDPLALLLDASLEGELELVQRTARQVEDPSAANDEGITALHNAICAGHLDIVEFLVEFGCDVNAQVRSLFTVFRTVGPGGVPSHDTAIKPGSCHKDVLKPQSSVLCIGKIYEIF